jgi:hypothetical protein
MPKSELMRYVSHLQQSLVNTEVPVTFDQATMVSLVIENADRLREIASYRGALTGSEIETHFLDIIAYEPETKFQTAYSAAIFKPQVEEIAALATELGIGLARPILVANLPDIGIGPLSRPSSEAPMIFAGLGTSTFCNYWAKIYSTLFSGLATSGLDGQVNRAQDALSQMPMLVAQASKISIYYAYTGTTLYFGAMREPASAHGYRVELLNAMEIFVLSHEFAHLYLEEKNPGLQGNSDPEVIRDLEFQCDRIAFSLCRNYGAKKTNWSAFCGVGAFLFFEAVKTSYFARERLHGHKTDSDGHPSPIERQQKLFEFSIESTAADQKEAVSYHMEDLRSKSNYFSSLICSLIDSAFLQNRQATKS